MSPLLDGMSVFWNNWELTTGAFVFIVILVSPFLYFPKSGAFSGSKRRFKPASISTILIFALFIFLSIILRLAFVSKAIFPSYFDSAQHYWIIKNILAGKSGTLPIATYYHLGFHLLAAFIVFVSHAEITKTMLILGQIILALIPFALFLPVKHQTRSNMAAWFAVILAAFGWYMPAHAVDWGKYPALLSAGLIPLVIGVALFLAEHGQARWKLYGLLGLGVLISVFAHSRSVIVFAVALISWVVAAWWKKLPRLSGNITFVLLLAITILQVVFIWRNDVLTLLFDPYLNKGIWITALVLSLSVFGYKNHSRLIFACTLTMSLLFVGLFVPMYGIIPGYDNLTLLDRPYVEMILFIPLSLLGGLGLAGLEKALKQLSWGRYIGLLAIGITVVNAFFTHDLYPSDCCVIVGNDDVVAIDWVANQLPVHARIGVASTELRVVASNISQGLVGADAGIWITPLTGRATIPLPNHLEFDQQPILDQLCDLGIDYLYVGEMGQPFDVSKVLTRPEWYTPLLSMPKTGVYEVVGCE